MAASSGPDPEERDTLSSWERRVLADIEGDLATTDPRLARRMAGAPRRMPQWWWPMSLRATVLLVLGQLVLVGAAAFVPSMEALLAVLTVLVVVPWIALCAVENSQKR